MVKKVRQYSITGLMAYPPIEGETVVVMATDYATLEAENAKLRAELERRAVPDVTTMAKALCKHHADLCGVDPDDQWTHYSDDFKRDVEVMLAAAPSAPKADERPLYTCIGKGGEYRYMGTAIGAGDSRGELAEVYQDRTGQLFHRTPEDFMERMEPIAEARKGEGE